MAKASTADPGGRSFAPLLLVGSMLAVAVLYVNAQYPNLLDEMQYKLLGSKVMVTTPTKAAIAFALAD